MKWLKWTLGLGLFFYLFNFLILGFLIGPEDFDHLSSYYELAWHFWKGPWALPHYNPFFCGGRTLGGDPQIPIFHPLVLLAGLLGPVWTLRLEMLLQLFLGCWGLKQIFERLKLSKEATLWGILLFILGGSISARFMVGHVTLGFLILFPLFFSLSYSLYESLKFKSLLFYFLLFIYSALYKPNFFLIAVPLLAIEALARSFYLRSFKPLFWMGLASVFAAGITAVIYLPSWHYFSHYPRLTSDSGLKAIPLYTFLANLIFPLKAVPEIFYGPQFMMRHEYNHFLGPLALLLSFLGFSQYRKQNSYILIPLFCMGVFALFLGLGTIDSQQFNLYSLFLNIWPGFESIRVPVRFWFGTGLVLILFSALGFELYKNKIPTWALIVFGLLPLILPTGINLFKTTVLSIGHQWMVPREISFPQEWILGSKKSMYGPIRESKGVLDCVTNVEALQSPAILPGPIKPSDVRLSLEWKNWNTLVLKGKGKTHFTLPFNHHPQWDVTPPLTIVSQLREPLSLQGGTESFWEADLRYQQPLLLEGAKISSVSLFLFVIFGAAMFFNLKPVNAIGITGGVASGKSLVSELLREKGYTVIDMDEIARQLSDSDPQVKKQLVQLLGSDILENNQLRRDKMRQKVFSNPTLRKKLEAILHPKIISEFKKRVNQLPKNTVVFGEAALLVEGGFYKKLKGLIVISAPAELRKKRLMERDKISETLAQQMIDSQLSNEDREKKATWIIENKGSKEEVRAQLKKIIQSL